MLRPPAVSSLENVVVVAQGACLAVVLVCWGVACWVHVRKEWWQ